MLIFGFMTSQGFYPCQTPLLLLEHQMWRDPAGHQADRTSPSHSYSSKCLLQSRPLRQMTHFMTGFSRLVSLLLSRMFIWNCLVLRLKGIHHMAQFNFCKFRSVRSISRDRKQEAEKSEGHSRGERREIKRNGERIRLK